MPYPKYKIISKNKKKNLSLENGRSEFIKKIEKRKIYQGGSELKIFFDTLESSSDSSNLLKRTVEKTKSSRKYGYPILFILDDPLIRSNFSSHIIDLMERGWISALVVPLSFAIMDFEISLSGKYIDYSQLMNSGKYISGVSEETGLFFNYALKDSTIESKTGFGETLGGYIARSDFKLKENSILYTSFKLNIPFLISSAYGTHPLIFHSDSDGSVIGKLFENDFMLLSSIISKMDKGGTLLGFSIDEQSIKVLLNAILFSKTSVSKFNEITFSIFVEYCSDWLLEYEKSIHERKDINLMKIYGKTDIMFPMFSSMIKH